MRPLIALPDFRIINRAGFAVLDSTPFGGSNLVGANLNAALALPLHVSLSASAYMCGGVLLLILPEEVAHRGDVRHRLFLHQPMP
jgi:hypothetical protein